MCAVPTFSVSKGATKNTSMHRGTFIAWQFLSEFAVVGVDTRSLDDFNKPSDYCKIVRLSDHVIFFSSGLGTIRDHRGQKTFDINQAARNAFVRSELSTDPRIIGNIFAKQITTELTRIASLTGRTYVTGNGGLVGQASFIGGAQRLSEANIIVEANLDGTYQGTIDGYGPHGLAISGYEDVLWANLAKTDADALKTTADRFKDASDLFAFEENEAALIERAVRVVIDHGGDELFGGEPAVAILDLKAGFRWYRQPTVCQEQ
jgi:hypothetical protein